jgi:hypothetical protein
MKLLFISDCPPCKNYTGGLVINSWCDFLLEEGHEIYFALIKDRNLKPDISKDKTQKIKFLEIEKPKEYWGLDQDVKFKKIRENLRSLFHNNLNALIKLPQIASKISKFAKENNCELILVSIQGQTITRLVRKVTKKTKLEYVAQIWDPLEWWMKEYKFDPLTKFINIHKFKSVIRGARKFMAMSWAMSNEFENKYQVRAITNIPGLNKGKISYSKKHDENNIFVISYAGQLYAREEFDSLIEGLKKINWSYKGKQIILNLYGAHFDKKYHNTPQININGYIKQEKLLNVLAESDLLYCPYWFSKEFSKVSRISFPAKLVTYLKTGKPVLVHAPEYASPRILLGEYKAAYICDSLNVNDIIEVLKKIIQDNNRDIIGQKGFEVFKKFITYESMKNSLLASLDLISENEVRKFENIRKIYYRKSNIY